MDWLEEICFVSCTFFANPDAKTFCFSFLVKYIRLIVVSLGILIHHQFWELLTSNWTMTLNARVRFQRLPGQCLRFPLHPQRQAYTGQEVTIILWMVLFLFLTSPVLQKRFNIAHIMVPSRNEEDSFRCVSSSIWTSLLAFWTNPCSVCCVFIGFNLQLYYNKWTRPKIIA